MKRSENGLYFFFFKRNTPDELKNNVHQTSTIKPFHIQFNFDFFFLLLGQQSIIKLDLFQLKQIQFNTESNLCVLLLIWNRK